MRGAAGALVVLAVLVAACGGTDGVTLPGTPVDTPGLVAAGDIASCDSNGDSLTAASVDSLGSIVLTLGDNAYESGTPTEFAACYGPTWGRFLDRTFPAPGNHDYVTPGAAGYFGYFGARAGPAGRGYYSFDHAGWHFVSLNSEIAHGAGSPQEQWLRADLAASHARCTLAYWHRPRFSSSQHGSDTSMRALWAALEAAGADVVLSGHDHVYERFAPQTADGVADAARGIREFVVGTGGRELYAFGTPVANSEVRYDATFGVLRMRLTDSTYAWEFVPVSGGFRDSGTGACH